jgi:hypothetical protein
LWKLYKRRKNQIMCHEIEPNPSKDTVIHEGNNVLHFVTSSKHFFFKCIVK